jgi:glyoxylase-like metal-dependent hydrolase (beta-lactamase superfamily II)
MRTSSPKTKHTKNVQRRRLAALMAVACVAAACGGDTSGPGPGEAAPDATAQVLTRDLEAFGRDLTEAVRINDFIYQARGTANAQMVVTPAGNVIIDTGLPNDKRLAEHLRAADDGTITHLILSHAHADHFGAADSFIDEGTEVIAHAEFPHNQYYLRELTPYLMPRNRIFYPEDVPALPALAHKALKYLMPTVEPTLLVRDQYAFELGGMRFEVIAMPGAEGSDGLCVWLPDHKILFTGDLFGHIFPMWPNLTTTRGERARFPLPYIESLDRVLELDPDMLIPSHFEPVADKQEIRETVTRIRDAVQYVNDAVIDGMNDGKDVYTLMREIELPAELRLPEVHGKVSWGVRSIWEAYTGWFYLNSTTEFYDVPASAVHPEVVAMAGGADALAASAAARVEAGEPVEALHLVDMALTSDPENRSALQARLAALRVLLERSGGVNHHEVMWLRHRIAQTEKRLER